MFDKGVFKGVSRTEIKNEMKRYGFNPKLINDKPNFVYKPHKHLETKYLVCLKGAMKVTVKRKSYDFQPGDRLVIPGDTTHSGVVSDKGCIYYWSERMPMHFDKNLSDSIEVKDTLEAKARPSDKKKYFYHLLSGWFSSKRKDLSPEGVNKVRVVDRRTDLYKEKITDHKTRRVIRDVEEKLSEHKK